jgi:hypothetical protein
MNGVLIDDKRVYVDLYVHLRPEDEDEEKKGRSYG